METVTEFIIDLSGSMKNKIDLTKRILLSDIIPSLNYSFKIGIKSFSAVQGQAPIIQELPLGIVDREAITKTITELKVKQGGTPISEAIRMSVKTLKEYASSNKKIVLITDGEEDKGGDYIQECKTARLEGVECQIHVIGIGLTTQAQIKAQEISRLTNGSFSHIPFSNSTSYNQPAVKSNLTNFLSAIPKSAPLPRPIINLKSESNAPKMAQAITRESGEKDLPKVATLADNADISILYTELINEIKDLKSDLKSLKKDNDNVPEVIEDNDLNEKIRLISENYLYEFLKLKYPNRVKWLNEKGESYMDHDFEILEEDGVVEYYIECKGTANTKQTFYMTKNEWRMFLNNTRNYQIFFIRNALSNPSHVFISNVLDWLLKGRLLPYLKGREIIKEERVFLTISDSELI